jgi:predicted nucleic acid-binding protein
MIAVDTSVWVVALRDRESVEAQGLAALLDRDEVVLPVPVRIEILVGASRADRKQLRRLLSALPVFYPTDATWERIDTWIDRAGAAGERFGFADLLIAALARDREAKLWSLDADFQRMARMGLIDLHRP